jgi:Protein of unknown function (DUF808)
MSIGLIALLDDIAAIAKVAAASLDDVASQAAKACVKAAGVVIDDTAVTPSYVIGFAAKRELPIVGKIAAGSLRNKLLILLPAALALSYFLPWAITPLLMFGGAYLCYEGVEKVFRPRSRYAHLPDIPQRRRHGRHDLGWGRHRYTWPGGIRPTFNRSGGRRSCRSDGSCAPIGRRSARMDTCSGHIRGRWSDNRRGLNPGRRTCLCARMETVEEYYAGLPEQS